MSPMATDLRDFSLLTGKWQLGVHIFLAAVLFGFGVCSRLYCIHDETPWHDENITWTNIEMPRLSDYIAQLRSRDATFVPAYYVLLYYWSKATSHSAPAARILSVTIGAAAMLLLYMLGRFAFGPVAGIVALAFIALSNTHVYFSQEIRVYPLYVMAAILSMLAFLLALKINKRRYWALHQVSNGILVLSHYFGALIVAAQGLYLLLFYRHPLKRLVLWSVAQIMLACLVFLWMLGIDREVLRVTTAFLQPRPLEELVHYYTWSTLYWPLSWYQYAGLSWCFLFMIGWLGVRCFCRRKQTEQDNTRWRFWVLCVLWMVIPMTAALVATYTIQPVIMLRYMLPVSAAFFLLVGGAIASLPKVWLQWTSAAALIIMLFVQHAGDLRPFRPDYQSAGQLITENIGENDYSLIALGLDWRRYLDVPEDRVETYFANTEIGTRATSLLEQYNAVWAVCVFSYKEKDFSYQMLEENMGVHGLKIERWRISSRHHTFLANNYWPKIIFEKIMVMVYRFRADDAHASTHELSVPPQPAP